MNVVETKHGNTVVLRPAGKLDSISSTAFETQAQQTITAGAKNVVLDFSDLSYISSAGLRVLLSMGKRLKQGNGKLAIALASAEVKEILDISGFTQLVPLHPSVEAAVSACG